MTYGHVHEIAGAVTASELIVPKVLAQLPGINSVLDVGGGAGAWAATFRSHGVATVCVQDHPSAATHLRVGREEFQEVDFRIGFPKPIRTDLVVCLEVAEHLPIGQETALVEYLIDCGDTILFAGGVPGQGGVGHINLRPHDFWLDLFKNKGLQVYDSIRPLIINDLRIPYWYRQNIFLVSGSRAFSIPDAIFIGDDMDVMHKSILRELEHPSVRQSLKLLFSAIQRALRRRLK